MKRYIADQHFFDSDVMLLMDKRPFESIDDMNNYMVSRWNETVQKKDEIYVIGDMFSWRDVKDAKKINRILHQLHGRIHLIIGNHDDDWHKKPGIDMERFASVNIQKWVKDEKRDVLLNHYPIPYFCKNHLKDKNGHLSAYMLHGHTHNSPEQEMLEQMLKLSERNYFLTAKGTYEPMFCNLLNCFCGFSDYRPLTLNEWIEVGKK